MSKIDKSIAEVVGKMKAFCSIDVVFGKRDLKADRRPVIELVPEDDGTLVVNNNRGVSLFLPLTVNIVVDDKDELRAYEVLNQCLIGLNEINPAGGYKIGSGIGGGVDAATMTQSYEASTFRLAFPYTLSFLITGA